MQTANQSVLDFERLKQILLTYDMSFLKNEYSRDEFYELIVQIADHTEALISNYQPAINQTFSCYKNVTDALQMYDVRDALAYLYLEMLIFDVYSKVCVKPKSTTSKSDIVTNLYYMAVFGIEASNVEKFVNLFLYDSIGYQDFAEKVRNYILLPLSDFIPNTGSQPITQQHSVEDSTSKSSPVKVSSKVANRQKQTQQSNLVSDPVIFVQSYLEPLIQEQDKLQKEFLGITLNQQAFTRNHLLVYLIDNFLPKLGGSFSTVSCAFTLAFDFLNKNDLIFFEESKEFFVMCTLMLQVVEMVYSKQIDTKVYFGTFQTAFTQLNNLSKINLGLTSEDQMQIFLTICEKFHDYIGVAALFQFFHQFVADLNVAQQRSKICSKKSALTISQPQQQSKAQKVTISISEPSEILKSVQKTALNNMQDFYTHPIRALYFLFKNDCKQLKMLMTSSSYGTYFLDVPMLISMLKCKLDPADIPRGHLEFLTKLILTTNVSVKHISIKEKSQIDNFLHKIYTFLSVIHCLSAAGMFTEREVLQVISVIQCHQIRPIVVTPFLQQQIKSLRYNFPELAIQQFLRLMLTFNITVDNFHPELEQNQSSAALLNAPIQDKPQNQFRSKRWNHKGSVVGQSELQFDKGQQQK